MKFPNVLLSLCFIVFVPFFCSCGKKEPATVHFYCCETFWDVMRAEAYTFQQIYGIRILMVPIIPKETTAKSVLKTDESTRKAPAPWRSRPKIQHKLFGEHRTLDPVATALIFSLVSGARYGDIYLTDSPLQLESLRDQALASHEYPFCYLSMTLAVPKGNPLQISSTQDALDKKIRLGVMDPTKDGMGYAAIDIITTTSFAGKEEFLEERVHTFGNHDELYSALEQNEVDAVLIWDALVPLVNDFAEAVSLGDPDGKTFRERAVLRPPLISLSTTHEDGYGRRFADFLVSVKGQQILKKYGFSPNISK